MHSVVNADQLCISAHESTHKKQFLAAPGRIRLETYQPAVLGQPDDRKDFIASIVTDPTTATTLFGIDIVLDQVVIQSPANAGLVQATGSLGVTAGQWAGFDNYSEIQNGQTQFIRGFASLLRMGGREPALYEIELLTGKATSLGRFKEMVVDIAIPLDQ